MPKRSTMLAILAAVVIAAVIFYLVSRPRVPAGAVPTVGATEGSGGQRTDESRAVAAVGAGIAGIGDVVGALA